MNDPHWNRVDNATVGFGLLGVVSTLVLSPSLSDRTPFGVLIFGGPIVFAASVMLVQRWLLRRAARTETVVAGARKDDPNGTAPL